MSISLFILLLAVFSLVFNLGHVFYILDLFAQCRLCAQQCRHHPLPADLDTKRQKTLGDVLVSRKPWGSLSLGEKLLLIDSWLILSTFANLIQIYSAIVSLM